MEAYCYDVLLRVWGQTRGEVEAPSQSHCCVSVSTGNSQDLAQLSDRGSLLPSLLGGLCADLSSNRWTPEAYCTLNSTTQSCCQTRKVSLWEQRSEVARSCHGVAQSRCPWPPDSHHASGHSTEHKGTHHHFCLCRDDLTAQKFLKLGPKKPFHLQRGPWGCVRWDTLVKSSHLLG